MKILCLMLFLDGTDRFEKDDQRTVDDARGARFVANGWAKDVDGRVATGGDTGSVDLAIDNSQLGAGDNHG